MIQQLRQLRHFHPAALLALLLSLGSLAGRSAVASTLTYADHGTPVAAVKLTAAGGPIMGYFAGASAVDTDSIALLDRTTGQMSPFFFNNHATAAGTIASVGTAAAGDAIEFVVFASNKNDLLSSGADNPDGVAHTWITPFFGGLIGSVDYPAGIYVGFEDLLRSQRSDFDYNDNPFVFPAVQSAWSSTAAPEPASLALLGTGAFGAFALFHRKVR